MTRSAHSPEPGASSGEEPGPAPAEEFEVLDAYPVLAADGILGRVRRPSRTVSARRAAGGAVIPAVQAAAVAAGGFIAGAAVVGLVHRRQRHTPALGGRGAGRALTRGAARPSSQEAVQVLASSTFIVDVHRLGVPSPKR